jgi:hypothetical protein
MAPRLFNKLPQEIKNINKLKSFVRSVKNWLINLGPETVEKLFEIPK